MTPKNVLRYEKLFDLQKKKGMIKDWYKHHGEGDEDDMYYVVENDGTVSGLSYCKKKPDMTNKVYGIDYSSFEGMCMLNAMNNQKRIYKDKCLKIVCGSIGIWKDSVAWIYGSPDYTACRKFFTIDNDLDGHVWLEDSFGNVYDFLSHDITTWSALLEKPIGLQRAQKIEGLSKEDLKQLGLNYLPARKNIQARLIPLFMKKTVAQFPEMVFTI